jgi:hypothetical protein
MTCVAGRVIRVQGGHADTLSGTRDDIPDSVSSQDETRCHCGSGRDTQVEQAIPWLRDTGAEDAAAGCSARTVHVTCDGARER